MSEEAIVRKPQVVAMTGRSYMSIRRDIARGTFPAPRQIGPRAIGWKMSEIRAWIESRGVAHAAALAPKLSKVVG